MAYTPKNNFNFQLKRTGVGEIGFRKKLLKDVTCTDPEYYFRLVPKYDSFYRNDSQEVEVVGGVGDFSWSISGSGFSLTDATTSGRTNTVGTNGTVETGDSAVLTVVDSCGTSISGNLKVCYNEEAPPESGILWGWGDNSHDSLGSGTGANNPNPVNIDATVRIGVFNVGFYHSASITDDYYLETTGNGEFGKLGLGDTNNREFFTSVDVNEWRRVSLGYWSSLALRLDGSLYGCGRNYYGELGIGDKTQRSTFTHIVDDVSKVSTDRYHTLIVKTNGTLWATGKGSYGALGLGDYSEKTSFTQVGISADWTNVFVGSYDSFALTSAGVLYGCGWNHEGVLGIGDEVQRNEFALIPGTWKSMSIGDDTSMGIKSDGTLWVAGNNTYGQLGLGDTTKRISFTQVGSATNWKMCAVSKIGNSCFALQDNGNLYSSGQNAAGILGLGDYDNRDEFTQIPGSWNTVTPGGFFIFGIKNV